jgi:hypothetical protein
MRIAASHARLSCAALLLGASFFASVSVSAQTPAPAEPAAPVVKPKTPPPPPKKPVKTPAKPGANAAATDANGTAAAPPKAAAPKAAAPANPRAARRQPAAPAGNAAAPAAAAPAPAAALPNGRSNPFGTGTPAAAAPGASAPQPGGSLSNAAGGPATSAGAQRAPVQAEGLHVFHGADYSATAYGCYRSGTRVLCDFDVTKAHPAQGRAAIWHTMQMVDSGGKINPRHDAYFLFEDGSKAPNAFLSDKPVRFIMEFDNIGANITSVTLSNGADRAESIPITAAAQTQAAVPAPATGSAINP